MDASSQRFHIELLKNEFRKRKSEATRYSLRSFASDLGIHHTALSRIMSCTQEMSYAYSALVIQKLGLSPQDRRRFLTSVAEEKWYKSLEFLAAMIGDANASSFEDLRVPFENALHRLSGSDGAGSEPAPNTI